MPRQFITHRAPLPRQTAPSRDTAAPGRAVPVGRADAGQAPARAREIGGPEGPEPTRYGDWERKGICVDF